MSTTKNYENLLEVKDLHTYFYTEEGVVKAVDGVSFSIKEDEILGLVGETGCGKSVTALSVVRLIRSPGEIVSGEIFFQGEDMTKKTENEMLKYRGNSITMIFQDPMNSLNPVLKCGDQLSEVYLIHQKEFLEAELEKAKQENAVLKQKLSQMKQNLKTASAEGVETLKKQIKAIKSRIKTRISLQDIANRESAKLLDRIGLPNAETLIDRYPHELSGGMRQRIMIAMGLACNAKLLICDEPTTALDVTIQAQILDMIRELKKKLHNSVLFITHSLGVIYELCDKVAVMYSGNIVEYGTVKDIFENPQHPYTKGLLAAIPRVTREDRSRELAIIPGMVPNLIYPPRACRFHPRCEHAMSICQEIDPPLIKMPNDVQVACHLFNEDKSDPELYRRLTLSERLEDEL
ncbi:ABC transporter ATP-binding protein [Candidatus Lokiarchaeum ossiferum]|uniref:ABC transporter ATP-binding protein n=1 Tax=Candidatus Lokiarchaeum ossiferum TaxID=2951803 RepID=UPI00352F1731